MWDSFLIFLAKHPFMVSIIPVVLAAIFLYFGRKSLKYQIPGTLLLFVGIGIGSVLHFRWDSYSIHFYKIDTENFDKNKILFIGDSITAEGKRPRGFITKLESILQAETETICAKGATSDQIISLLENYPHNLKPSYIFAQSGINDLINGLSEEETKKSQNKLLESIRSTFPSSIVLFIPIHPFFKEDQYFITSKHPFPNSNIISWWGNPITFAENYLIEDGVHLNANGNTKLAKTLAQNYFF
jgi:lysophospholipase L1-like esterase